MIIDNRDKTPEEEFMEDLQEFFTHVHYEDENYIEIEDDLDDEYLQLLSASYSNRGRGQALIDSLQADEDRLKYMKDLPKNGTVKATNKNRLDKY